MDSERARYLKTIEDAFVALRGRGFMLSPRDVALIDGWRKRGVPDRLVVRAMTDGARRFKRTHPPGAPLPGTLAYFANQIEQQLSVQRERTLGYDDAPATLAADGAAEGVEPQPPDDAAARVLEAIVDAGRVQTEDAPRDVLRATWRAVKTRAEHDVWSCVREVDAAMVAGLLDVMDAAEREGLEDAARAEVAAGRRLGPEARGRREQAALERRVRERFEVPDLVEVALR